MTFFVGIDSGGTHTNMRLITPEGEQKSIPELDRSLSSNRSNTDLREVLRDIFASILSFTRGEATCVWINAAGYSAATKKRFDDLLQEVVGDVGNLQIGISNDAIGLLLAHDSEYVVTIAGTGSVSMARTPSGGVVKRGGDEWVVADYGSAFWLGLTGIRSAYSAWEGGPDTALLKCLLERYRSFSEENDEHDTGPQVQAIARSLGSLGSNLKPIVASFAPDVTRQAELGDEESQKIVRRAADELASASARVYREVAAQAEGRVVMPRFLISGSVAYRSPFYLETVKSSLDQFLFDVRENIDHAVELNHQLNGLSEALSLAKRLEDGPPIPQLVAQFPYAVLRSS
jgi:N-acetylglucosamine kinase-like BadF-type ATPase